MNEQAETKLSTIRPTIERERRARLAARAEIALLVASPAATAGEERTIDAADRSNGGAMAARRSANRDMATPPGVLSVLRSQLRWMSVINASIGYFCTITFPVRSPLFPRISTG